MIRINQTSNENLAIVDWVIARGEIWSVLSKNGSEVMALLDVFAQITELKTQVISFKTLQQLYEYELKIDQTDITDEIDVGTLVSQFLPEDKQSSELIDLFDMRSQMSTGFRQLSTGNSRKLMILRAALTQAELIVCESPFDSLDEKSKAALSNSINKLSQQGVTIILVSNNKIDIPKYPHQYALLEQGNLNVLGGVNDNSINDFFNSERLLRDWPQPSNINVLPDLKYLCELYNCSVDYAGKVVFSNLNLTIKPHQHTLITGDNGAGKSTLLELLTGDCPQCFSNEVTVFGYRRGNGETIWDIKKHLGLVSSELHRSYRIRCSVLTVISSGFFDSIGLYQPITNDQLSLAKQWLQAIGLEQHENALFHDLSHGEQRLVLIARAMIKTPLLLVLDEPTQGLDEHNRDRVLNFLKELAAKQHTTILYVSHRADEYLAIFNQHLHLTL